MAIDTALQTEAREMALTIINGSRRDAREFIAGHDTPAKLVLAIVRHLIAEGYDPSAPGLNDVDAVVNVQSLIESLDV